MTDYEDPAVRDALRRRALREKESQPDQEEAMNRSTFTQQRNAWIWKGLLPGILSPLAWIGTGLFAWALFGLGWSIYHALKLSGLKRSAAPTTQFLYGFAAAVLLVAGNAVIAMVVFYGACAMSSLSWC